MNTHLRPGYLDPFINVARIICDDDPPPWLADRLWRWNGRLYQDRRVEELRPTRTQMRRALLEVEEATLLLTEALAPSWVREFLDASPSGPIADPERLSYTHLEICSIAHRRRKILLTSQPKPAPQSRVQEKPDRRECRPIRYARS
jgi:hypothetical protein